MSQGQLSGPGAATPVLRLL